MCIYFILALCFIGYSLSLHEDCLTNGQAGTCQQFNNCSYAIKLVQENNRPDICEFEGLQPIVCCPHIKPTLNKGRPTPLTDSSNTNEESISVKKCLQYYPTDGFFVSVTGGEKSLAQEFPHMAVIGFGDDPKDKQWLCGGSLISKKFILTAAHCLHSNNYGSPKWVRLGDLDLSTDTDDADPQDFNIIRSIPHPEYKYLDKYHDIALLELDRTVRLTTYVSPACLHNTKKITAPVMTATGWGVNSFLGDSNMFLMKLNLQEVDEKTCSKAYSTARYLPRGILSETQICAGGEIGKDTCVGDSGGPLQAKNEKLSKSVEVHTIIGITSFGKACGLTPSPGVYIRVSYYLKWIESIVWSKGLAEDE